MYIVHVYTQLLYTLARLAKPCSNGKECKGLAALYQLLFDIYLPSAIGKSGKVLGRAEKIFNDMSLSTTRPSIV